MRGTNQQIIESVTATSVGHLQLLRRDYHKERMPRQSFAGIPALVTAPGGPLPPGSLVAARVHLPVLVSNGEQSTPALFEGIDPAAEARVSRLRASVRTGRYLLDAGAGQGAASGCPANQLVLGQALADLLKVKVGETVALMTQTTAGKVANEAFEVIGTYDSGSPNADKAVIYAQLGCVQQLGGIAGIHEVVIRLPDAAALATVKARLTAALPGAADAPALVVTSWREVVPGLAEVVSFNDATLVLVVLILAMVTTFGVVNTLLMSVYERTRELGVMLSLGMTPGQVRALLLVESLLIGIGAALAGAAVGIVLVVYHRAHGFDLRPFLGESFMAGPFSLSTTVYPVLELVPFLKAVAAMLGFVALAGVYPAHRAGRMDPVEALRSVG